MTTFDQLHRYLFKQANVRGEVVRLHDALSPIVHSTEYPVPVQRLLAEMAAATCLLTATLKFEGEISLQIQSKGIVKYAVISATHDQTLRGVARWDDTQTEFPDDFASLTGDAFLVITITPDEGERYQGVIALDKPTLGECLEHYFEQSEQLATHVILFTDADDTGLTHAGGMLLQIMPESSEATQLNEDDLFHHLSQLSRSMTSKEFFELPVEEVLYRLYHQEEVTLYPAQDIRFACTCSRERSAQALKNVDKSELLAIVAEEGSITMHCQYCHSEYRYDAVDIEAIHQGAPLSSTSPQ